MHDPRYVLFMSLLLFTIVVSIILFLEYYDVYLWGTKAEIIVFTSSECDLCGKFVKYVMKLEHEGFHVRFCDIAKDEECKFFMGFFNETRLPIILPMSVIIKNSYVRGIVLGDWYGLPFWYMLRDTDLNNHTMIPVYKRGEITGILRVDNCFQKEFTYSMLNKNYTVFKHSCIVKKSPYTFVSLP